MRHREFHRADRSAVIVAGISGIAGVAGVAGVAGLVTGAISMAAGEYVSVSSQADTDAADMAREKPGLTGQAELAAFFLDSLR